MRTGKNTILPENWVQVTHSSGMPLYLNRASRVCTLSRPYYINELSARKHDIPISAIPCLAYRRRKDEVEKQIKEHNLAKAQAAAASRCPMSVNAESQVDKTENGQRGAEVKKIDNKKVVVSIQTDEEKSKENLLGKKNRAR